MPKSHSPGKTPARRRNRHAERDAAADWENRLDLRREVLIALLAIPAGTAVAGLLAWHRAFVEPLWASPVSALLIMLTVAAGLVGLWHFIVREPTKLWAGLAVLVHFPVALAPASLAGLTADLALDQRGVVADCTVAAYESTSRSGRETLVRHRVRCASGTYEQVTSLEDRHAIGASVTVTYDPEHMIRPTFGEPKSIALLPQLTTAVAAFIIGVGFRLFYVYWRVRRSRKRRAEHMTGRRTKPARN